MAKNTIEVIVAGIREGIIGAVESAITTEELMENLSKIVDESKGSRTEFVLDGVDIERGVINGTVKYTPPPAPALIKMDMTIESVPSSMWRYISLRRERGMEILRHG